MPDSHSAPAVFALSDSALAIIGGADEREGYALGRLAGATLIRDRIVVGDGLDGEIRFYDLTGHLVVTTGRLGAGPGEFRSLRRLAPLGDSAVVAWDIQLRRITLVAESREVRVVRPDLDGTESMVPEFIGATSSGEFVFRDRRNLMDMRSVPAGPRRDSVMYLYVGARGETSAAYRAVGDEEWFLNEGERWTRAGVIFGARAIAVVTNEGLLIGETDHLAFRIIHPDGRTARSISLAHAAAPASAAAITAERQRLVKTAVDAAQRSPVRFRAETRDGRMLDPAMWPAEVLESVPASSTLPAYSSLYPDRSGFWYCLQLPTGQATRCHYVVEDTVEGRLDVPKEYQIQAFFDGLVLVSSSDELDRQAIRLYRFEPARAD